METKHFTHATDPKMACSCCGNGTLSIALLLVLEDVRRHFSEVLSVGLETPVEAVVSLTSGARCVVHNKAEGGSKRSTHIVTEFDRESEGADITVKGFTPFQVYQYLKNTPYANLLGLGKYTGWVHVDVRGYPARW